MTKTINAKEALTIFKSKRTPPLTFDDESELTFDDESPLTFDDESELTFDDETAVFKDATIKSWDNGSPESGEYVIRVSLMARHNHEDEWTYQSFELRFDDIDERNECIQHYTKLYDVKSA